MSFCFSDVPAVEHQRGSLALCLQKLTAICAHTHIQACSWVAMALALGSVWVSNAFETTRHARVQASYWVSMAPALGSL